MRFLITTVFVAAVLTFAPAHAADLGRGGGFAGGVYAGQIEIFDYEPGVVVRAYWLPPWNNRHYFPVSGSKPKVGRVEDQSQRGTGERAGEFYREWSSFPIETDAMTMRGYQSRPIDEPVPQK